MGKTGITERASDRQQPFRVWHNGQIIRFAKTRKEAEEHLAEAIKTEELHDKLILRSKANG